MLPHKLTARNSCHHFNNSNQHTFYHNSPDYTYPKQILTPDSLSVTFQSAPKYHKKLFEN